MSEEKSKGGRPKKPYRLTKSKMMGVRLTPHHAAMLRALQCSDESLTSALERLVCEALDASGEDGARYFMADEARLAGSSLELEGVPGDAIMRAVRSHGFWRVEVMREDDEWHLLSRLASLEDLPIHEDETW